MLKDSHTYVPSFLKHNQSFFQDKNFEKGVINVPDTEPALNFELQHAYLTGDYSATLRVS